MFRKKVYSPVVIAQDLTKIMLKERVIPISNCRPKKERELIVLPRGIRGHKVRKKKPLKW